MEFPASNLARVRTARRRDKPLKLFVKYMGLLGPQGALPLATTEEAYHYVLGQRRRFPALPRHLQSPLSSSCSSAPGRIRAPIAQHDRPDGDRFFAYIGSCNRHRLRTLPESRQHPGCRQAGFAGLLGSQAKSASRLASALCGLFEVESGSR